MNIGIEGLRNDLKDINKKLNELETRLRETEERLDFIEEEINKINPQRLTPVVGTSEIIGEINDRAHRAQNVILYKVSENRSPTLNVRLSHDKEAFKQLLEANELGSVFKDIKLVRLGKTDKEKLRPLKVVFPSDHHARIFMEKFSRDGCCW